MKRRCLAAAALGCGELGWRNERLRSPYASRWNGGLVYHVAETGGCPEMPKSETSRHARRSPVQCQPRSLANVRACSRPPAARHVARLPAVREDKQDSRVRPRGSPQAVGCCNAHRGVLYASSRACCRPPRAHEGRLPKEPECTRSAAVKIVLQEDGGMQEAARRLPGRPISRHPATRRFFCRPLR